jgi:tricorn protease
LAADLAFDPRFGHWQFIHIVTGNPWELQGGSSLLAPGVRVSPGDLLLAVNGRPVDAAVTPASLLVNQAGLAVELTVARSDGVDRRNVVVTALRDEQGACYREWVVASRAKVHEASSGRVGYVHVP